MSDCALHDVRAAKRDEVSEAVMSCRSPPDAPSRPSARGLPYFLRRPGGIFGAAWLSSWSSPR